jgi:dienelactone hydrolase
MRRVPVFPVCLSLAVAFAVVALVPIRATRAAAIRFIVTPNPARGDQPISIRLVGLAPGQTAFLSTRVIYVSGSDWDGGATFRADTRGVVDVATQAPLAGSFRTYSGIQPMGLIWSAVGGGAVGSVAAIPATMPVTLTATIGGNIVAQATLVQAEVLPSVTATAVHSGGLYGVLSRPAGHAPAPGVLVLGGSEGGLNPYVLREAALLADHGYAALALAYFGEPGLPRTLANVPLEYFGRALAWLGRQSGVRGDRLGVVGHSRGGELALLLGAHYPQLRAVVSYVGSGIVFGSWPVSRAAAWTWRGRPIAPYTTIPVERTAGSVLLLAAADDMVWPSPRLLQAAMQRLRRYHHPYADHLVGHAPINWSWSNCHPRLVNERHGVGSNRDGLLRINST